MADTPPPPSNPAASPPEETPATQETTQADPQSQSQSHPQTKSKENEKGQNASQYTYIQYDPSKETTYVSAMQQLIMTELSEPYSIYVYRYFLYQWGELCFMVYPLLTIPSICHSYS